MNGKAGMKRGMLAAGTALLMVVGLFAAFAGSASAAPVHTDSSATVAWAYGGENSSSGSITIGKLSASWSTSIGVVVILNATPTVANTTELEEQRTVGVSIAISLSGPNGSIAFNYHATEQDKAFANVTNDSTVYVAGAPVAALGIDNSSFHGQAALSESLVAKGLTQHASAYLNASAHANASVEFTPALGLIPLNLHGVSTWNSTANATPSANWRIAYHYAFHGWNNTTKIGMGGANGSWEPGSPVQVNLTGQVFAVGLPHFHDHQARLGVVLTVQGPANIYEGFIVLPRHFDVFGGGHQSYDQKSMSNVTISGDMLFVNSGRVGAQSLTASEVTVGGQGGAQPLLASPVGPAVFPAVSAVGSTVVAQPESVSAAQSQSHCLEVGCPGSAPWFSGLVAAAVIGGLIAAVAGTVGVVEWRSYARRKNQARRLVGGYSEGLASGFPPAVGPSPSSPVQPPAPGPSNIEGPGRQP
jgi:hypothetical protein